MKRDIDFISFSFLLKLPNVPDDQNKKIQIGQDEVATDDVDEHPYMQNIRKAVLKYRLQSAAHFDVDIRVEQASQSLLIRNDWATDPSFHIEVRFSDFNGPEVHTCQTRFRTNHKENIQVPSKHIMIVSAGRRPISINKFLRTKFPALEDEKVLIDTMQAWWRDNGKQFNWAGLPTELKQLVVQNCLHQLISRSQFKEALRRQKSRWRPRAGVPLEFGIFEIVDQLGDWASVLGVSHQVRAIALRLCFMGGSEMTYDKGFCIFTKSMKAFRNTLSRLERYYQLTTADGLPIDEKGQELAHCYKYYPKIYKHLDQYSTFCHGIRRICMTMDFFDLMSFFRVDVGGFGQHIEPGDLSHEVFDRLPHLAEIAIELPGKPKKGWSNVFCRGPLLFHHDSPCPRVLHRLIYGQIVDTLILYPRLIVQGFIDDNEEARFESLREAALKKSRWTAEDFAELYADCGGGVQLDETVVPGSWLTRNDEEDVVDVEPMAVEEEPTNDYFPPKCHCEEKCLVVFNERQHY